MNSELLALALLASGACLSLLLGLLRVVRRISSGAASSFSPGRFLRGFPFPLGLTRRPTVFVSHVVLTWGMVVVTLRTVTLIGRVSSPGYALFSEWDAFQRLWVPLHEWTVLSMLAAVGYLLLRRWVLKPRHLTLALSFEAVLFWLALLLTFDFLHESAHVALLLESGLEDHSVFSSAVGHLLMESGLYQSEMIALSRFSLWVALMGAAALPALAPWGHNTHWLTGWAGLMIRTPTGGESTAEGASTAPSRKAIIDAFNCTECGQCDQVCEGRLGLEAVRPSALPLALRSLMRSGDNGQLLRRWRVEVGDEVLARCDKCGDCDAACPLGIELTAAVAALNSTAGGPPIVTAGDSGVGGPTPALENSGNE